MNMQMYAKRVGTRCSVSLLVIGFIFLLQSVCFASDIKILKKGVSAITFKATPIEAGGSTSQPITVTTTKAHYNNSFVIAFIKLDEDLTTITTQLPYLKFENSSSGLFIKYFCTYDAETKTISFTRVGYNLNIKSLGTLNMQDEEIKLYWYLVKM